jgi:NAD(P)-dependent dehydrogenase (short-subunit alcohol dehydrogenase family)
MTDKMIALVTGAGSGVGRAVALELQANGYSVVLAGRRQAQLDETAARASAQGGQILVVPADVADPDAVEALFAAAVDGFGRLDVLFNNAGINAPPVPMDELNFDDWKAVIDINLTGSFLCARQAMRVMKRQDPKGGRIINNGSVSAHVPRPNSAPYTASKHAVSGLTRSISLDGRAHNIACGQIDIGNAASEMWEGRNDENAGMPQANGSTAIEPIMDVEHVAKAVAYMAGLPLEANVQFMTVMATGMPYIGRG